MVRRRMVCWVLVAALCAVCAAATAGPLQDFVRAPDPGYGYTVHATTPGDGYTVHALRMTSQTWREGDVTPHAWEHWLTLVAPDRVASDKALLFISGGSTRDTEPPAPPQHLVRLAVATGSVAAVLRNVPCQPMVFAGQTDDRYEDAIIAMTFHQFAQTLDPTWPLLAPMVKSAVRAMDTVQDYAPRGLNPPRPVNGFVVTGASKRGWTTWLTAAVDRRVVAIAPMVIDVLNMRPQMAHQRFCFGDYSEEIDDYSSLNLMDLLETPEGGRLLKLVDPYEYRRGLRLPKLVMLGSGDQYWTVDAAKFYFPQMPGEKHLYYEPNADHGMGSKEGAIRALSAFYHQVLTDQRRPRFSWRIRDDGTYSIRARDLPAGVRLWKADAPTRDFRMITIGEAWSSEPVTADRPGRYSGRVPRPESGFSAFYFELLYPSGLGFDYGLTTIMTMIEAQ